MEKNLMEKLHSNMSYNTYSTVQKLNIDSVCGLILAKTFILDNFSVTDNVATILAGVLYTYYISSYVTHAENYTRDVKEIKNIYNELIIKYNKLNDKFDFNNPIEIYTMLNFLIYKGYLSKDKQFEFGTDKVRDIISLYGANIFNGQAVCRHIASMLKDIYSNRGIESSVLSVYLKPKVITIHTHNGRPEQTTEQLYEFVNTYITNEKQKKIFNLAIAEAGTKFSLSIGYTNDKIPITKSTGNHAITMAIQDEKSYIVDPTQTEIYKMNPIKNESLIDKNNNNRIKLCQGSLFLFNKYNKYKDNRANLNLPSTTFDEDYETVERTKGICKDNLDVFEQFYSENSDVYDEISDKLLSIKKAKTLIKIR